MSKLQEFTDLLPGGESRAAGRDEVAQANQQRKLAVANAKATKETNRPWRTRVATAVGGFLVLGTAYFLSTNDGGEAIGEAGSETIKTGVKVIAGVGSVGVDVASGALSGASEGISEVQDDTNINVDNPFTQDENSPVSNTTPNNSGETSQGENSQNNNTGFVAIKGSTTITEVPVGEDGSVNYSAPGVIASPIQVAKDCFGEGFDLSSQQWADVYQANILTVESNFTQGGAFYEEQQPTLNPGDTVFCE